MPDQDGSERERRGVPQRRFQGSTTRRTWGQLAVACPLAVLGFAAAVQVQANDREVIYPGARRGDLVQLLASLDAVSQRAEKQIDELEETKRELQTSTDTARTAQQQAREEATTLAILAGTVPATGSGVSIVIQDPEGSIGAATILNAIEELRDAGAEAIEINDVVRVVAQTYFADAEDAITVDGTPVRPPYVIDAIGSGPTLSVAVVFPGGLSDEVQTLGGSVEVEQAEAIDITALSRVRTPQYAQPTP